VVRWFQEQGLEAEAIASRWEGERDDEEPDAQDEEAESPE
jgi:hypothetical protein